MYNKGRLIFIAVLLVFLGISCAQERTLSGGDVDEDGPVLELAIPSNYSTEFNSKSIYLEFDEYIQLKDVNSQLIVSPPLSKSPKIELKKKSVIITFKEVLKANTTYTLNFGDGIVDYTVGNPTENLRYVFSTGNELDSMQVSGKVQDAKTNIAMSGYRVMLYKGDNDSLPFQVKPDYLTKSNKDGTFMISNVAEGDYKIIVLDDQNLDFLIDEGESFGFLKTRVEATLPDSNSVQNVVTTSIEDLKTQFVKFSEIDSLGGLKILLNKISDSLSFDVLATEDDLFYVNRIANNDSVYFMSTNSALRNTDFRVELSEFGEIIDTLYLQTYDEAIEKIKLSERALSSIDGKKPFEIELTDYMTSFDPSLFVFYKDSVESDFDLLIDEGNRMKLISNSKLESDKSYEILILPNAIKGRYENINDSIKYRFSTFSDDYYGSIEVNINGFEKINNPILILEDSKGHVVRAIKMDEKKYNLNRLKPGSYILKIIEDVNDNGQWNPSIYELSVLPESVLLFPENIKIRSNWILDYDWTIE